MAELPGVSDAVQWSENARKNFVLNYETVALPAELRRRERANIASARTSDKRRYDLPCYSGSTKVSPISRSAIRPGVLFSAASKRSIGSRSGSKLSRNV